ncbi:hypothetical protein HOC35_05655 [Candidatus Woesearchaeota archaeon]|jgi:hypothetical protein|nr:hypothetical protein [Candidatus Woesearchaeota archaeon]
MERRLGFRNNMDYSRFKFRSDFNMGSYRKYIRKLKESGAIEIEHVGKNLQKRKQRQRAKEAIKAIHDQDMKAILYTGIFGGINISGDSELRRFAQRNKDGKILSYQNGGEASAMMCPSSKYIEHFVIPQINRTLEFADYDGIFLDIPWIMHGGCDCNNCYELREDQEAEGKSNNEINAANVRHGLEKFVKEMKKNHPYVKISINASAPTIYTHKWHGAEIDNLAGLFDQYVTEWNPLRTRQNVSVVTRCIEKAIETVEGIEKIEGIQQTPEFYHATTCTDGNRKVYPAEKLSGLFHAILEGGALPRLGVAFGNDGLGIIKEAWHSAVEMYKK